MTMEPKDVPVPGIGEAVAVEDLPAVPEVETIDLEFPIYTLEPKNLMPGEGHDVACIQDMADGEFLGLIFTSQSEANRYMHISGLNENLKQIASYSHLVFTCRWLIRSGSPIKTLVLNYGRGSDIPVKSMSVTDIANTRVPEDDKDSPTT